MGFLGLACFGIQIKKNPEITKKVQMKKIYGPVGPPNNNNSKNNSKIIRKNRASLYAWSSIWSSVYYLK